MHDSHTMGKTDQHFMNSAKTWLMPGWGKNFAKHMDTFFQLHTNRIDGVDHTEMKKVTRDILKKHFSDMKCDELLVIIKKIELALDSALFLCSEGLGSKQQQQQTTHVSWARR